MSMGIQGLFIEIRDGRQRKGLTEYGNADAVMIVDRSWSRDMDVVLILYSLRLGDYQPKAPKATRLAEDARKSWKSPADEI
jgi:hypothetical protein